jgi:hypothetical protein
MLTLRAFFGSAGVVLSHVYPTGARLDLDVKRRRREEAVGLKPSI